MKAIKNLGPSLARIALFLDYDGTLVPIRSRPGLARLGTRRRAELRRLGQKVPVAIVSGRPLAEIRRLVGVPGLDYIGNHGFEIWTGGRKWIHPGAARRAGAIARAAAALRARTRGMRGVTVEDKGLTASVHFRLAPPRCRARLRDLVAKEVRRHPCDLTMSRGKMVLELRPAAAWDKGRAVRKLMRLQGRSHGLYPIYIGDDRTDEDAFRALRDRGLTIRVGRGGPSLARRRVRGVDEVWAFLAALLEGTGLGDPKDPANPGAARPLPFIFGLAYNSRRPK